MLQVGPASAGAYPGPVCYGRGGTEPTVTDANLLLGYVDPELFWGGRLALDVEAAPSARSDERWRGPLGLDAVARGLRRLPGRQREHGGRHPRGVHPPRPRPAPVRAGRRRRRGAAAHRRAGAGAGHPAGDHPAARLGVLRPGRPAQRPAPRVHQQLRRRRWTRSTGRAPTPSCARLRDQAQATLRGEGRAPAATPSWSRRGPALRRPVQRGRGAAAGGHVASAADLGAAGRGVPPPPRGRQRLPGARPRPGAGRPADRGHRPDGQADPAALAGRRRGSATPRAASARSTGNEACRRCRSTTGWRWRRAAWSAGRRSWSSRPRPCWCRPSTIC